MNRARRGGSIVNTASLGGRLAIPTAGHYVASKHAVLGLTKTAAIECGIFGDAKDGWGLAFWYAALNSFLDDERPQDVLATDPERVIAAAEDEVAEYQHG